MRNMVKHLKRNYFFYLLALPGTIVLFLFSYMPMSGIYLAFENYNYKGGLFGSEFVGWDNFKYLFGNADLLLRAIRNTLVINIGNLIFGTIVNVATAIMLNEIGRERFRKTIQTLILFPYFLSWIIVGTLSSALLDTRGGVLNQIITFFGGEKIRWSMEPQYWWAIIIIASVWKCFGYSSIVYYSTISGFNPSIYEAARVDGAGRWKQVWHITLPMLKSTIALMTLLSLGSILGGSLEQIMGMTKLGPYLLSTTDTITTFVYRATMEDINYGASAAASIFQSVVGCVLVLTANLVAKKLDPDYALF